ncbi:hypothetical protein K7I13_09285 [Brucepastera parasyntrophica]|uniref:hypothetical protein n=1 Tax=Brucepastera parasyntrophica TaxID=2880008 RepID=UPI00210D559C|nr:hypothetical protein [Brucepastera parasyntrophica]ULQ58743.1 hypothetical protein K7I13_09285 [Brucepastera parasyntrophica]
MNILLYGTKKDNATRAAERFFRERQIPFQFRDLSDKPLSEGELKNICAGRDPSDLIDTDSKSYEKENTPGWSMTLLKLS